MDIKKIISMVRMYQERLVKENVPKKRMDPNRTFASLAEEDVLAHAHFISDGIEECAERKDGLREVGAHLATVQICLSLAGWYTLKELMDHGLLTTKEKIEKMFEFLQGMRDHYGRRLSRLNNDPGAHYQEANGAEMELYAVKSFKSCLENVVDLDEKKVFALLDKFDEEFRNKKQPEGLSPQAVSDWRQEMRDKATIRWVLRSIRENFILIMQDNEVS